MAKISIKDLRAAGLSDSEIVAIFEADEWARTKGPTWVYALADPFKRKTFYIGIATDPWKRFREHSTNRYGPAFPHIQRLLAAGASPQQILKPYKRCATRSDALKVECRLIFATPELTNLAKFEPVGPGQ